MKAEKDSVVVLIGGKKLRIDLYNLKDPERAKENKKGGEHYFGFDAAQEAAKAVGKRLMTEEEQRLIMELPSRWDDNQKGWWFEFNTPEGGTVEVFFPASGRRNTNDAMLNVGNWSEYWSSSPYGASFGYYLHFEHDYVYWGYNDRRIGFPVRCVVDEENAK